VRGAATPAAASAARRRAVGVVTAALRAPALHFLALGALLFALAGRSGAPAVPARPPIVITAERIAEIRDDYQRTVRAVPTAAELDALIARDAEEEMLYREALLLKLDRRDGAVEWRVIEKMRFLYGDAAGDNGEALARGLALGLQHDDVVVRNALVTKVRLLAKAASRAEEPTEPALDRELEAYLRAHGDFYAQPERLSLTHIFLSAAKRGATLEDDARAMRRHLEQSGAWPDVSRKLGDAFAAGTVFRGTSPSALGKIFGEEFATAVASLEPGRWSDPLHSPYGLHLVWINGREAGAVPPLSAVRSRVLQAYRAEQRARYLAKMLDELRSAYEVRVEHGPRAL
jgi:hypothetical protein